MVGKEMASGSWQNWLFQQTSQRGAVRKKRICKNIDITGTVISAKVAGRKPQPYKVNFKLWKFTAKEKKDITNLIMESPYYLSQLEARILPTELYDALLEMGIKVFPSSWKDLKMKCSCPDWAVPCKHLAAVVYIIANEIDKNPFLVFSFMILIFWKIFILILHLKRNQFSI